MRWFWRSGVIGAAAVMMAAPGGSSPSLATAIDESIAKAERGLGGAFNEVGGARIATWNVRWFPDGTYEDAVHPERATDVGWLAREIRALAAPVVAVQEFKRHDRARAAAKRLLAELDAGTGGSWKLELDDCPNDGQPHLGFLYDTSRVRAGDFRTIDILNPLAERCDGALHPGLSGRFEFPGGLDVELVNVHFAAGDEPDDIALRRKTYAALAGASEVAAQRGERDVVFLDDFNTNGCPTCDASPAPTDEIAELARILADVRSPLRLLPPDAACSEYFEGEPLLLDHVAVPTSMAEAEGAIADVRGYCVDLACTPSGSDDRLPAAAQRLSDHCPIVVSLRDVDAD